MHHSQSCKAQFNFHLSKNSHLVSNQLGSSLASLAQGTGKKVKAKVNHSHHLRSIPVINASNPDKSAQFILEYMKSLKNKRNKSSTGSGNNQFNEPNSDHIEGLSSHHRSTDSTHELTDKKMENQPPLQNHIPKGEDVTPPAPETYSLADVMTKLAALTGSVSKIDTMAKQIDSIAKDVKAIRILQDTITKLSQEMSEAHERISKMECWI